MPKTLLLIGASILAACSTTGGGVSSLSGADISPTTGLPYCDALGLDIPELADIESGQTATIVEAPDATAQRAPRRINPRSATGTRIPRRPDQVRSFPTQIGGDFAGDSYAEGAVRPGTVMGGLTISTERYDRLMGQIHAANGAAGQELSIRCIGR